TVGVTCLTRDGAVLFRGPQGQRCRSLCSAPMRVRRGWEGRAMSTTDSVAGGSPGPGTPGAGPSADMSPQAGPRAPGAVPGAAPGRGRKTWLVPPSWVGFSDVGLTCDVPQRVGRIWLLRAGCRVAWWGGFEVRAQDPDGLRSGRGPGRRQGRRPGRRRRPRGLGPHRRAAGVVAGGSPG